VVVIGAGFAGLSCAYQLKRVGADVQVLEARNRVGGRVFTLESFLPGKVIEAGAELIGGNHPTWMAYAKEFGLSMRDVSDDVDHTSPLLIAGKTYSGKSAERLWDQIDKTLALMNADARPVDLQRPWLTPQAEQLDRRSLAQVAEGWAVEPHVRAATLALMSNDNVLEPAQASYLALLSSIAGGGMRPFGANRRSTAAPAATRRWPSSWPKPSAATASSCAHRSSVCSCSPTGCALARRGASG
jgi:monoamine oxidase